MAMSIANIPGAQIFPSSAHRSGSPIATEKTQTREAAGIIIGELEAHVANIVRGIEKMVPSGMTENHRHRVSI
jgi:hypothetical protein